MAFSWIPHVYLNSVQQMVSGELAGEGLQTGFSRHGLHPQRAPLDTVYPLREHLNSVQRMVSGGYCEGLFPDTVCWTRLRNTWIPLLWIPLMVLHAHEIPCFRGRGGFGGFFVPPNSQSLAVKAFYFTASRICRQFFVKFLAPTFPGN